MIAQFDENRKKKTESIPAEAARIEKEASELDFSAIGKMLCGQKLSDEDKKTVEKFNDQYDRINELK